MNERLKQQLDFILEIDKQSYYKNAGHTECE